MFAYALLTLAAVVTGAPESDNVTALNGLTQLAALLGGLLIAVTSVVNLAERRPPRSTPTSGTPRDAEASPRGGDPPGPGPAAGLVRLRRDGRDRRTGAGRVPLDGHRQRLPVRSQ